jgi:hypothetical protein
MSWSDLVKMHYLLVSFISYILTSQSLVAFFVTHVVVQNRESISVCRALAEHPRTWRICTDVIRRNWHVQYILAASNKNTSIIEFEFVLSRNTRVLQVVRLTCSLSFRCNMKLLLSSQCS